ncbi:hypothetical protein [Kitasatospora sp. NPDC047058]|uniref:hypothetical protein n=1 Tax=Kitasatospora sp. NPDC047058 TaxID=3155620 RepID=UPI0033D50F27
MSLVLTIKSWRLRSALMWLAHHGDWRLLPLVVAGALVGLGQAVPEWLRTSVLPLTGALVAAGWLGGRLHDELDDVGIPCRWCEDDDLVTED